MNRIVEQELIRNAGMLQALAETCREDLKRRYPDIDFDGRLWAFRKLYGTRMLDMNFSSTIEMFSDRHPSYMLAFRCLIARKALEGKTKTWKSALAAWRLLNRQTIPLVELRRHHLVELEEEQIKTATARPLAAKPSSHALSQLSGMLDQLARLNIIGNLGWGPSAETRATLTKLENLAIEVRRKEQNIEVLDRQIEGLSDATKAMLLSDERLTAMDRSAIAVANILMCAPSRINEPLCMQITDRYTIEDYATRPDFENGGKLYQSHQLLLMKGSKGAAWSGKPILNFMIGLSDTCWNLIRELGTRSRFLLEHYEKTPDQLFLPPELETLRGNPVSKASLWQIINLTAQAPTVKEAHGVTKGTWNVIAKRQKDNASAVVLIDNPRLRRSDNQRNPIVKVTALSWQAVETVLLERVRERMAIMRRVTDLNTYTGPLSKMLVLVDCPRGNYLPYAWNYEALRHRLKTTSARAQRGLKESVFIQLGLQMTVNGKLEDCYLDPHDPRRWLTTKALEAKERLSDVLINKWANRVDIGQLAAYDLRTAEQKADQAEMPVPHELQVLQSITTGLKDLEALEKSYGLRTDIVVAQGDSLAVTSVDAVIQATEDRPAALSGNQIIILYPNRYGICLHQHHEIPCRAYSGCSAGCNEQLTVKGHLPTNEEWRKQNELNNRSIVNQLQALITAREWGVADEPAMLDAHLLTLVKGGLDVPAMAEELIQRFHEIKDQIRDPNFKNELEAAFVARGVVTRLDDPSVPGGALIKDHNPGKHASPGYERAIEAQCGGREEMERQAADFHKKCPELAPRALGLEDQRHFLKGDDRDDEEDEDGQAA
ncbi:hypothetical protein [Paraburkholderia sp. MM5384-R2]|uniref:hypothetical protein n=1 Tax=Paraburkholderia sp. MM5384-R2 TaxID=2723097 RepID=UPI0016091598|nr:hypothetical protein [Paraburkholderia sp. MM5384-R2]MBB5503158.1 hypothetical protein [Paraburkholderia sp. MM5384-R2]